MHANKSKAGGAVAGGDLGLSLTGLRIGPIDPATKAAKVGLKNEIVRPEHSMASLQPRIMKERTGFSGGFKIPEDYRKSKEKKKGLLHDKDQEEDLEATQQSQITKDEIFQQLNLGHSEAGIGIGRHGTNSKSALAKDIVEGIEKDLEKLKRRQENLQLRKAMALNGGISIVEETHDEREREMASKMKYDLEGAGAHVIYASPKKMLVMRHQASQLASTKNLDLDELERMREENAKRVRELEEMYMNKKQNSTVGKIIREKMGYPSSPPNKDLRERPDFDRDYGSDLDNDDDRKLTHSQKKKKSVRIVEEKENHFEQRDTEIFGVPVKGSRQSNIQVSQTHVTKGFREPSRSASKGKKSESPIRYDSPRRKLYEAKFEKYLSNKGQKVKQEKKLQKLEKEDFDRYTKGPESPAKSSKRFFEKSNKSMQKSYDQDTLIPKDYDEKLLVQQQLEDERKQQSAKKDKFRQLGVSNEDKMTFYLLKWVFNAIKRDSSQEDPKLKGRQYVTKGDLVKQLSKNEELMRALGYEDVDHVVQGVKEVLSIKEGCLLWEEFLDFFFLRQSNLQRRGPNDGEGWWRRIGQSDAKESSHHETQVNSHRQDEAKPSQQQNVPRYGQSIAKTTIPFYEDPDKKEVKMTQSLKILQDTRIQKTAHEVEDEFRVLQEKKLLEHKGNQALQPHKKQVSAKLYDYELDEEEQLQEQLGIKREKSKCLLLQSQIFIMQEIYDAMDKYRDKILRRADYIMSLRTDERVVEFIDVDAVQIPYSKKLLTLDEVLVEIEKDELYELAQLGKNHGQINHKEFITWREFMSYFNDYRDIEERNRKIKEIQRTRQNIQKERHQTTDGSDNQALEIMTLMEKEKQRRLQELPRLRPADQIDVSEKQLQLLRDIYDQLPVAIVGNKPDMINTIDFFIATRKNPQLRAIASTIARDPEGYSRIPRETFQQVFDRMENEITSKQIDWPLIVEYFTKRGRPLTKEEINKLIDDDKREKEEEETKKKNEEEAERRRMARLMEDLEDKEDFEEFEMRQKSEATAKMLEEKKFNKEYGHRDGDDDEEDPDRDYEDEYYREDEDDEDDIERGRESRGRRRHRDQDDEEEEYDGHGYTSDPELVTAQRSYKFADRDKAKRAQSAKRTRDFDERNLKHTKLTTKDYFDNDGSLNQKKKGKYGVTVPKPFQFDIRDKSRPKSIRERKIDEMIAEKQIKEENILKHQFRSNPIPPEVLIPRYKTIVESNEMRRLEVKKNSIAITKQTEKPFSFYERDKSRQKLDQEDYLPYDLKKPSFKANPIPRACSVLIFDQMMKKEEQERQERIRKQAELNFSKAKLPDRMQMHQEKLKQDSESKQRTLQEHMAHSFKPKINDLVTREQFEKQQIKFNQKLQKKKSQMQVTRPKSPNFTKRASKNLDREYLNEGESAQVAAMDKFKQALSKQINKTSLNEKATENPSSTNSMNLAMQRRREELEAKRKQEEDKKKEDKDRFERQNRLKNVVQTSLKDRIKDDTQKRQEDFEKKKREARDAEKEQIIKKQEMLERVKGRPLLVERLHTGGKAHSNLAKIKATMEFIDVLKQNNLNPNDHLSEEQKELLAENEYVERRKKELGKQ